MSPPSLAFYLVTGREFFLGAVAAVNSLRLAGHGEPMYVLDCGLEEWQREILAQEVTVVSAPRDDPPSLLKLVLPQAHPARVMALLDADLIVTGSLREPIERAAAGAVVAFENDVPRHFLEWGDLLELGPVRPGPYLTSSAVFIAQDRASTVFPLVESRQAEVPRARTWLGSGPAEDPLYLLDQDVLNAVLLARLKADEVIALPARLAPIPPFAGVRLRDPRTLACEYRDGTRPLVLHHCFRKPWLVPVRSSVYSRLLTRLLLGADVPMRLAREELPRRLRDGTGGRLARAASDLALTPAGLTRRLRRRPTKVTAWPQRAA